MYIKRLKLKDFRNYKELDVVFDSRVNILLGKNAQGKTNLLEAIYTTSLGKSFRTGRDSEMIRFGAGFLRIEATACKDGDELIVEIAVSEDNKGVRIDGVKAVKNSDLLENIYTVIFSPEDLKIVKDEPEKRRRFIDREICQLKPSYYMNLSAYKKALAQRNALLKERHVEEDNLSVWDQSLAYYGRRLMDERKSFVAKLNEISRELHRSITNGKEELEILYEPNCPGDLLEKLARTHGADIMKRSTGTGPHKDDLKLSVNGIDIRHYGSQGQQRTAALSLKLAELKLIKEETGEDAVLLLDDVLSELDSERQTFLINSLGDVQLFITTAELTGKVGSNLPEGKIFFVDNGKISLDNEAESPDFRSVDT